MVFCGFWPDFHGFCRKILRPASRGNLHITLRSGRGCPLPSQSQNLGARRAPPRSGIWTFCVKFSWLGTRSEGKCENPGDCENFIMRHYRCKCKFAHSRSHWASQARTIEKHKDCRTESPGWCQNCLVALKMVAKWPCTFGRFWVVFNRACPNPWKHKDSRTHFKDMSNSSEIFAIRHILGEKNMKIVEIAKIS